MFLCELYKISNNMFSYRTRVVAASVVTRLFWYSVHVQISISQIHCCILYPVCGEIFEINIGNISRDVV